jgi:hypothetical protein
MIKKIIQNYEFAVVAYVEVDDDYTDNDVINDFTDFPVRITVDLASPDNETVTRSWEVMGFSSTGELEVFEATPDEWKDDNE